MGPPERKGYVTSTGTNSRRSLWGKLGARVWPRGWFPSALKRDIIATHVRQVLLHFFWRIQRGEGEKEKTYDWGRPGLLGRSRNAQPPYKVGNLSPFLTPTHKERRGADSRMQDADYAPTAQSSTTSSNSSSNSSSSSDSSTDSSSNCTSASHSDAESASDSNSSDVSELTPASE